MELYSRSTERTVSLDIPVFPDDDGDVEVSVYNSAGTLVFSPSTIVLGTNTLSFDLPHSVMANNDTYTAKWSFNYQEFGQTHAYVTSTEFSVVTPILPMAVIGTLAGTQSTEEKRETESAVRFVIQSHTGQKFERYFGKRLVRGSDSAALRLPQRLASLESVNGFAGHFCTLEDDGFLIRRRLLGVPSVKADYDGWHQHTGGVIHNPNMVSNSGFSSASLYEIEGVWGWNSVPPPVQEAAKLLVEDYTSPDSVYRDRYLSSMAAADWRIQFSSGAFHSTGNVRADQLLNDYITKNQWMVF